MRANVKSLIMISNTQQQECYVYITLPGEIKPVTAGRFVLKKNRQNYFVVCVLMLLFPIQMITHVIMLLLQKTKIGNCRLLMT